MTEPIGTQPTELVLLSGGSSAAGPYIARVLAEQGIRVCAVSRSLSRLRDVYQNETCEPLIIEADLTDVGEVSALALRLKEKGFILSAIVHLVGGWSGGRGIPGQTEEKYENLAKSFTSLRMITRQFIEQLMGSSLGRLIVVSSEIVNDPTPNGANYAAVKAATESWAMSCHTQLSEHHPEGGATIIRTDSLSGREGSFADLVGKIISAPASRVGGRTCLHV